MASSLMQNRGNKSSNRIGSTVSRKLRAAGWNISPAGRKYRYDGIYVSAQGDSVNVMVDLGLASKNLRVAEGISAELLSLGIAADIRVSDGTELDTRFIRFTYVQA